MIKELLIVLTVHMEAAYDAKDIALVSQVVVNRVEKHGVGELFRKNQFQCWNMGYTYISNSLLRIDTKRFKTIQRVVRRTKPSLVMHYVGKGVSKIWTRKMKKTGQSKYHVLLK